MIDSWMFVEIEGWVKWVGTIFRGVGRCGSREVG